MVPDPHRQRIVLEQEAERRLPPAFFGDVLMGRDPSAVGQDLADDLDGAPVGLLDDLPGGVAACDRAEHIRTIAVGIAVERAGGDAPLDHLAQRDAGFDRACGQPIEIEVALVAQDDAAVGVEHHDAVAHVVQRGVEQCVLLRDALVHDGGKDAGAKDRQRHAGDRHRENGFGNGERVDGARRVGQDRHRAHGGEVVRHDREREQNGGRQRRARAALAGRHRQRRDGKQNAERDRSRNEGGGPGDAAGHVQRRHSGVVHRGDAGADDDAARAGAPRRFHRAGHREAGAGHCNGRDKRERGERDVVTDRDARLVGEHRDEVGRPDAAAGRSAGPGDPPGADMSCGGERAAEQADGGEARREANGAREHDQPVVMLGRQTGQNAEHRRHALPVRGILLGMCVQG